MALYGTQAEQYTTLIELLKAQKQEQIQLMETQLQELYMLHEHLDYEELYPDESGTWQENLGYVP